MTALVRISIFGIAIYFIAMNICAFLGIDIYDYFYVLVLEYLLYSFAKNNRKAHCRWARFLALTIFMIDTFTYLDAKIDIIPATLPYLIFISTIWVTTVCYTIVLAIEHIAVVMRFKRLYNE